MGNVLSVGPWHSHRNYFSLFLKAPGIILCRPCIVMTVCLQNHMIHSSNKIVNESKAPRANLFVGCSPLCRGLWLCWFVFMVIREICVLRASCLCRVCCSLVTPAHLARGDVSCDGPDPGTGCLTSLAVSRGNLAWALSARDNVKTCEVMLHLRHLPLTHLF